MKITMPSLPPFKGNLTSVGCRCNLSCYHLKKDWKHKTLKVTLQWATIHWLTWLSTKEKQLSHHNTQRHKIRVAAEINTLNVEAISVEIEVRAEEEIDPPAKYVERLVIQLMSATIASTKNLILISPKVKVPTTSDLTMAGNPPQRWLPQIMVIRDCTTDQNWYADSGATNHVTSDYTNLTHPTEYGGQGFRANSFEGHT